MNISAARPDDLPNILSLLKTSGLPVAGIEDHLETTVVACDNGRVIGSAAVEVYGSAGLLRSVAVDRAWRGIGLGQSLTEAALALARRRGIRELYLLTTTADKFFPRFGFERIARQEIAAALTESEELRGACPETAIAMRAEL
jgi:amino-acid N-acetyltransferase